MGPEGLDPGLRPETNHYRRETMTRNPHEIVTLDDQPEGERYEDGEGYELGRAYGSPKPVDNQPDDFDSGYRCQWCGEPEGHIDDCPQLLVEKLSARIETLKQPTSKPMRIRYMELPGEINPNTNELATPFVIVIDRVTGGPIDIETGNAIALNTGARGILTFEQEIQIGDDPE